MCLNFYLGLLKTPTIKETKTEIVTKDTIVNTIRDFDTVYVAKTKYNDIYHYDTLHHFDTITRQEKVYIHDTLHNYTFNENDYDLDINAVRLDNYKLDIHARDTITQTKTVNTVTYKPRSNKPQIGLYGGLGYDVNGKTFGPEIGIGVVLPLTKW